MWFNNGGQLVDVEGYDNNLASLMRRHLQEQQEAASSGEIHVANKTFNKIAMLSRAWREKHRVVGLSAIVDPSEIEGEDELPTEAGLDQVEQAAAHLRQYWGKVFTKKRTLVQAQDILLRQVPTFDHSRYDWTVTSGQLLRILQLPKKSSPGPDGLPYYALAMGGDILA